MGRLRFATILALLFAPISARAQTGISGGLEASVGYTNNPQLAPSGIPKQSDEIYTLKPTIRAASQTQGLDAFLRYTLSYWHYQQNAGLDRAVHDLEARAKLTWWENFDLLAQQDLVPVPLDFGAPLDNPANVVQQSRTSAEAALRHDFDWNTHGSLGYTASHVDWFEVHKGDLHPPAYTIHGPALQVTRDIDGLATLGVQYRYRMQHWTGSPDEVPPTGDVSMHELVVQPRYTPAQGVEIGADLGFEAVTYAHGFRSASLDRSRHATRALIDAHATLDDAFGLHDRLDASWLQHVTQDVTGNPADEKVGILDAKYEPIPNIGVGAGGQWGDLHLLTGPGTANPYGDRRFMEVHGSLSWLLPERMPGGAVTLAASHHQTLKSSGSEPDLDVNRVTLSAAVSFR